jgi:hypothetical protein
MSPSLIDFLTIAVGLAAVLFKVIWRWRMRQRPIITVATAGRDFLNGCVIVPFAMLLGAPFSSALRDALLFASPVSLAIAGMIGLTFVIGELVRTEH